MFQLNKRVKLVIILCIVIYMIFSFVVFTFAKFNDIDEIFNKSDSIIYVDFKNKNIKCLLDNQGRELLLAKGKNDDIGVLYDIEKQKEKYLYHISRNYKDEKYYFSSYHYDVLTKIDLFTEDGKYLDTMIDMITNKYYNMLFCYKDTIFYMSVGFDIDDREIEKVHWGYTTYDIYNYYVCKLYAYDIKTQQTECIYIDNVDYKDTKGYMDLKYLLNDEILYIVTTNNFDEIEEREERKNVRIVSFKDMNNIKSFSYEFIGEDAKQAYIDWDDEQKIIKQFKRDEKESEIKKMYIRDYSTAIYGQNGLILDLNKKELYGATNKYLIVSNAFHYGLIDLKGNWFYKKSMFDEIDFDE